MPSPFVRPQRPEKSRKRRWMPDSMRDAVGQFLQTTLGGALFLVAFALALALFSYDAADPSWNTATNLKDLHNWMGVPGSYIADLLRQSFDWAGLLMIPIIAAWGWRVINGQGLEKLYWRVPACLAVMICAAIAIHCLSGTTEHALPAGGTFGFMLGGGLLSLLPHEWWTTYAVSIPSILLTLGGLYLACNLSLDEWHGFGLGLKDGIVWIYGKVHAFAMNIWSLVRNDRSGNLDEEAEDEEIPEEHEAENLEEEADEVEEESPPPRAAKKKEPKIKAPAIKKPAAIDRQGKMQLSEHDGTLPPLDLLQWPEHAWRNTNNVSEEALQKNAKLLEAVLNDFGVNGQITNVHPGPVVTLYELEPAPGTRASRVISLADDIARNMSAASVRVAVVPGRNVIGIELPNAKRETVYLRELLSCDEYVNTKANLPLVLGKDIAGTAIIADLARMPHLLIAGTTGSGKSVAINTMILSLLYHLPPQKCRFIMVDPKMLELSVYDGIPHLLAPVVTEPKKAIMALRWVVREMEDRYRAMSKLGVRNIEGYNVRLRDAAKNGENLTRTVQTGFDRETGKPVYEEQPLDLTELPFIVVIVDEMADLMMVAGKEIEAAIQRLAQMARAAGIHIMMATQRPSVDVITGTIKANFPTRISFQVTSKIDSRTILGEQGAEQLLGQGDMLYMAGGGRITRVHGPFVRDQEVEAIVKFLKAQGEPQYLDAITADEGEGDMGGEGGDMFAGGNTSSGDALYDRAVDVVLRERKASTSYVQRQLQIGYNKAANLIERMEREGIIGPANAMGKREVFGRSPEEE
ncbi:MAG: DNA translocase FtsK 4TM domain-containing protein [Alphaproteobacteria bacterium]|nr:DNA translocase FtsK 4TM domain-containing protein [Alphaproteobacteria bacterium]